MYIDKWWGEYLGGTDDTCTLLDYFQDCDETCFLLLKIFADFHIDVQQKIDYFRDTQDIYFLRKHIEYDVLQEDIDMVIDLITDLAALVLECQKNKKIALKDLDESIKSDKTIQILISEPEFQCLLSVLQDFSISYSQYDIASLCGEDEMQEMASHCKEILEELKQ